MKVFFWFFSLFSSLLCLVDNESTEHDFLKLKLLLHILLKNIVLKLTDFGHFFLNACIFPVIRGFLFGSSFDKSVHVWSLQLCNVKSTIIVSVLSAIFRMGTSFTAFNTFCMSIYTS